MKHAGLDRFFNGIKALVSPDKEETVYTKTQFYAGLLEVTRSTNSEDLEIGLAEALNNTPPTDTLSESQAMEILETAFDTRFRREGVTPHSLEEAADAALDIIDELKRKWYTDQTDIIQLKAHKFAALMQKHGVTLTLPEQSEEFNFGTLAK